MVGRFLVFWSMSMSSSMSALNRRGSRRNRLVPELLQLQQRLAHGGGGLGTVDQRRGVVGGRERGFRGGRCDAQLVGDLDTQLLGGRLDLLEGPQLVLEYVFVVETKRQQFILHDIAIDPLPVIGLNLEKTAGY